MTTPGPQNVDPIGDDEVADVDDAPRQAFGEAMSQLGELKQYAAQFVAAKIDLAKLSLRRAIILAALGIVALLAGAAMIFTLVFLLFSGLAGIIAAAFGGRTWAGDLIVSAGFLLALAGVAWLGLHRISRAQRDATAKRYERRHAHQRATLSGHDARQRSAEQASKATDGN